MNEYVVLMKKSDACCLKAIEFVKKGDYAMATFWKNASIGLKERVLNLTLSEIETSN